MNTNINNIHTKLRNDLLFDCVRKDGTRQLLDKDNPAIKSVGISVGLQHSLAHVNSLANKDLPAAFLTFSRSDYVERQTAYYYWVRNIYDIDVFISADKECLGYDATQSIIRVRDNIKWSIQGWKPSRKSSPMFIYSESKEIIANEMVVFTMTIAHEDLESYVGTSQETQDCDLINDWVINTDIRNYDKSLYTPKPPSRFGNDE